MTTHLTDTQKQTIRIALAKWMGWTEIDVFSDSIIGFHKSIGKPEQLPNYPASLDACHEIAKKLSFSQRINYHSTLQGILTAKANVGTMGCRVALRECIDAEPEERSLALYLSLNLGELGD